MVAPRLAAGEQLVRFGGGGEEIAEICLKSVTIFMRRQVAAHHACVQSILVLMIDDTAEVMSEKEGRCSISQISHSI
jgi:hypothetical protein